MHRTYAEHWADDGRRTEVSQGTCDTAARELLMMHWLEVEKLEEVKDHRLFVEFCDMPQLRSRLQ